jgi:hypothetical protein
MNSALPFSRKKVRRPRGRSGGSGGSDRRLRPPPAPRPDGPGDSDPEIPTNLTTLVLRAAFMDGDVYQIIRTQPGTTISAIAIVVIVALLIATGLRNVESIFLEGAHPAFWFIFRVNVVIFGWFLWWAVAAVFGLWVFKGKATRGQLFRALGIASAPGALVSMSEIGTPLSGQTVGEALVLFGVLWTLVLGTQAIKETLRSGWYVAAIPGVLGWGIAWVVFLSVMMWSPSPESAQPAPSDTESVTSTAAVLFP